MCHMFLKRALKRFKFQVPPSLVSALVIMTHLALSLPDNWLVILQEMSRWSRKISVSLPSLVGSEQASDIRLESRCSSIPTSAPEALHGQIWAPAPPCLLCLVQVCHNIRSQPNTCGTEPKFSVIYKTNMSLFF